MPSLPWLPPDRDRRPDGWAGDTGARLTHVATRPESARPGPPFSAGTTFSGGPLLSILDELPKMDRNSMQPLRLPVAEKYKVWMHRTCALRGRRSGRVSAQLARLRIRWAVDVLSTSIRVASLSLPAIQPTRTADHTPAQDMGVIVSGKIEAGNVKIGQELLIMPNQVPAVLARARVFLRTAQPALITRRTLWDPRTRATSTDAKFPQSRSTRRTSRRPRPATTCASSSRTAKKRSVPLGHRARPTSPRQCRTE